MTSLKYSGPAAIRVESKDLDEWNRIEILEILNPHTLINVKTI